MEQKAEDPVGDEQPLADDVRRSTGRAAAPTPTATPRSRRAAQHKLGRTVSRLRPSKVSAQSDAISVAEAVKRMAEERCNAIILTSESGSLSGILTDKDIAFRVVARGLSPEDTPVSAVMTKDPRWVTPEASAMVALRTMATGHFRHLPVLQDGKVVGLLDITKCLYDCITKIELAYQESSSRFLNAVDKIKKSWESIENQLVVSLKKCDRRATVPHVTGGATCREAAKVMLGAGNCAVMVFDSEGIPAGIFTSKDLVHRVISRSIDPEAVAVETVMTRNPDYANLDTSILDALHLMHDGKYLHLPILGESGEVIAVVDVLHLTYAVVDQMSSIQRGGSGGSGSSQMAGAGKETRGSREQDAEDSSHDPASLPPFLFTFKMTDEAGNMHKFISRVDKLQSLLLEVRSRTGMNAIPLMKYLDDEDDEVLLVTDEDLALAVTVARSLNRSCLRLRVYTRSSKEATGNRGIVWGMVQQMNQRTIFDSLQEAASASPASEPRRSPPSTEVTRGRGSNRYQYLSPVILAASAIGIAAYLARSKR